MMSWKSFLARFWFVIALSGLATLWGAASLFAATQKFSPSAPTMTPESGAGAIVMISGRDDHGLLADPLVPLLNTPDSQRLQEASAIVANVRSGSLAQVLEERGSWLRVQVLGSSDVTGWVNDYYLRNRAFRRDSHGEQLELLAAQMVDSQVMIAVRPVLTPEATPAWVAASDLCEVGAIYSNWIPAC